MSIHELTGLFVKEFGKTQQDAQDTVQLYLRQVRPFLAHRDGRYDFFFESFKLAAQNSYTGEAAGQRPAKEWHRLLAEYFVERPLMVEEEGDRHPNLNKLAEQPYQCTQANLWTDLYSTLTDFDFLEAKCRSYPVYNLETDFQVALGNWQGAASEKEVLTALAEQLRLESQHIQRHPELLFPQLYNNHMIKPDASESPLHTLLEQNSENRRDWLRVIRGQQSTAPRTNDSLKNHTDTIGVLVISSDSKTALSGSNDRTINYWDLQTGQLIRTFEGHTGNVNSIQLSPDGKTFLSISTSEDHNLRLWDLQTGRLIRIMNMGGIPFAATYEIQWEDRIMYFTPPSKPLGSSNRPIDKFIKY